MIFDMTARAGGGESMNVQHFEYIQATDSMTPVSATQGSTVWFKNTYFNKGNGLYWAFISNNSSTSTYKGSSAYRVTAIGNSSSYFGYKRPVNWIVTESNDSYFLVAAGSKIDVFFIAKSDF